MRKIAAFYLLALFPLVAQAGYVFKLREPTLTGIFIGYSLKMDKESIEYVVTEKIKDAAGKTVKNMRSRIVRHEEVNEEVLKQLSDTYGAEVSVSANEEYGIGQLNNDDVAIITDKNITIANSDITTTGNLYIRSNSQVTLIASDIECKGNFSVHDKEENLSCLSFYIFGGSINVFDVSVKVKNDVELLALRYEKTTESMESDNQESTNHPEL